MIRHKVRGQVSQSLSHHGVIEEIAGGLYFYRLQAPTLSGQAGDPSQGSGQWFVETKKLLLLK